MSMLTGYEYSLAGTLVRILTLSVFVLLITQADIAAARVQDQVKSKIEQDIERRNTPAKKPESEKRGRTPARAGSGYNRLSRLNESSVTILSEVPGTEIFIDGALVGKIDETRKLTTNVKKGQHRLTASFKGYSPQSMIISVAAERSTYTLNLGKPIPAPTPAPVAKVEPTPAPPPSPPPPDPDDIIRRFINPKETAQVTVEDWRQVLAQTEEALKTQTDSQLTARLHLARGQQSYLKRNYAESLSEFNRAIDALPLSGIAYYGRGNAYLATNQPLQAHKAYVRASELTPEVAALAHKGIGDALTKMLKRNEANSSYIKARDLGYVSPELNKSIARNLIEEKEWQKALLELTAIEERDKSAEIQLYLGECYENLKRPLSAFRAYAAAGQLDPNSALAFLKLGDLLYELNEFPEARDAYERALALDTTGSILNRQLVRKLADKAASLASSSSASKERK
jgi:tetratricopeptide (TPR) repeat protein